eukprot:54670-Rhodomonas_salina.1
MCGPEIGNSWRGLVRWGSEVGDAGWCAVGGGGTDRGVQERPSYAMSGIEIGCGVSCRAGLRPAVRFPVLR